MKAKSVAFFVNPLAGYGGIRNNKGSDNLLLENIADSISIKRAMEFLKGINKSEIEFTVPAGPMGSVELDAAGINYRISYRSGYPSTSEDTINFLHSIGNVELICFVGGDGTARDVLTAGQNIPVLGIPAGVKMYSSVFAMNIRHAIDIFDKACIEDMDYVDAEVDDIDEEKYRNGILEVRTFGFLKVPNTEGMVLSSKAEYPVSSSYDIAEYLLDTMDPETYYIVGPGNTCKTLLNSLGIHTNMLGFDIIKNKQLLISDAGEEQIFHFAKSGKVKIIISVIGGQGFLLGRGNQQLSVRVLEQVGFENICVVSSPEKLTGLAGLSVDLNMADIAVPSFIRVLTGYAQYRIIRIFK